MQNNQTFLTFGEAIIEAKTKCVCADGAIDIQQFMPKHKSRMPKAEAIDYYQKKISAHWKENRFKRIINGR